jgi:hypothetical protein
MKWKSGLLTLAAVSMLSAAPAWAACSPNDRIDGSTADQAKRKIEAAGYDQVGDLKKGCDNYWHGHAMKDGAPVNVVLSPEGGVKTETD